MIKGKALSLKHRVLIYFVLISVVAITSLSLGGVHFLENTLLDKDLSTSRVLAKEVHYNVSQVFTRAERDMRVIAAHPIINDKSYSMKQKLEKLKQLQGLIGDFENVSLLSLEGEILVTTNFNYRGGVKYAAYFKKALTDKETQVSPAYFTLDPKHIVFSFTTPVYDQRGEITYIMYAQLNVNQVTAVIGHLDFGESGEAQLIDEYGRFIAGVSDDELLTPVSGSLSEKLSLDIQGFRFDREGVRHGSTYREGRMTVVVSQSYQAVLSVIEKSLNKLIIYSVLVLVIVVIVGVYFSYTISRPLDSLVENIRSYSKGDRYQTSNSSTVPEEIGVLGESFNNMLGQIEQYQDEMEQLVSDRTEELAHARDRAEAANRTKTLFLKNMSHEIRTPMNAILGFTQLLKQKESDSSKLDLLKNVINAGNTLLKMLNDLLDLSKTSTATVGDKLSVVDLRKFLRELELVFLGPCSKKQLFFKIHVEEGLPSLLLLDRLN
ncbi:Multi-sensor Hybrid Histidine Kinase [Lentisphaera araneosa HTCC2155]|uniref:histidine kinase n=1 Tax=Lentisphaera araneosa HTCC2155 TaxID=313628 RepID=A6DTK8_9BACT|nr:sensor histidine kinase [Lentisphaera araneosa]EDM25047.1 Multi-sensor Hybrid Histidine Kinase [Lentisphaera araneosa HTCC2155]